MTANWRPCYTEIPDYTLIKTQIFGTFSNPDQICFHFCFQIAKYENIVLYNGRDDKFCKKNTQYLGQNTMEQTEGKIELKTFGPKSQRNQVYSSGKTNISKTNNKG